jgi:hypothetical protein
MSATKDAWDKLGRDIEDGTAKRKSMTEVKAEGREWSALDEEQWKAALFCLGYPPDMEQPKPGDVPVEAK